MNISLTHKPIKFGKFVLGKPIARRVAIGNHKCRYYPTGDLFILNDTPSTSRSPLILSKAPLAALNPNLSQAPRVTAPQPTQVQDLSKAQTASLRVKIENSKDKLFFGNAAFVKRFIEWIEQNFDYHEQCSIGDAWEGMARSAEYYHEIQTALQIVERTIFPKIDAKYKGDVLFGLGLNFSSTEHQIENSHLGAATSLYRNVWYYYTRYGSLDDFYTVLDMAKKADLFFSESLVLDWGFLVDFALNSQGTKTNGHYRTDALIQPHQDIKPLLILNLRRPRPTNKFALASNSFERGQDTDGWGISRELFASSAFAEFIKKYSKP